MGREVIVSSGDALRVISLELGHETRRTPLDQAGALCISPSEVFCACGNAIWRLDRRTLAPTGLFGGGPDMRSLLLSADGTQLYALCGDADSILMLSAQTGEPMLINRAGVNPREMSLDGEVLAVAGGESGMVILLCARTLCVLNALTMPGPVYSTALFEGRIYALCLSPSLTSLLIVQSGSGTRHMQEFAGLPGCLLVQENRLLAATEGMLYAVSLDGKQILGKLRLPGRAAWLCSAGEDTLMVDGYTESLFALRQNGLRIICRQAASAVFCGE